MGRPKGIPMSEETLCLLNAQDNQQTASSFPTICRWKWSIKQSRLPHILLQKQLRRKLFAGERNPFYGKKHSSVTRKQMSANHADFNGDKNPFKKSLGEAGSLAAHKKRCREIWSKRDEDYRKDFGKKIQKGHEEISGTFWARVKSNAKQRGRVLNVDIAYCWNLFLKQNRRCALSGIELQFSNKLNETTASLDRIDGGAGYTIGNVQWVHKTVNLMKRTLSDTEFIKFCKVVSNHQEAKEDVVTRLGKEKIDSST